MPRTRQRSKSDSTAKTHEAKLRALSRVGIHADPTNPRSVARRYYDRFERDKVDKRLPKDMLRSARGKTLDEAKEHGFRVTKSAVVVDGPRDKRRKPIKGARVKVLRGGVVQTSVGQRRDIIYGFTRAERKAFAKDPDGFTESKVAELMARFPTLRRRKKQIRLQWGAYQATKDFAPSYFTARYFASVSPEERRKAGKKARPRADKLTGLHIVVHVPKKKKGRK